MRWWWNMAVSKRALRVRFSTFSKTLPLGYRLAGRFFIRPPPLS